MNLFSFIKSHISILDVVSEYATLKKAGLYWKGQCPFHSEKTASFTVSPHKEIYYCFGCHAGGDAISFIEKAENCSPFEAAQFLIERYKLSVPETLQTKTHKSNANERDRYYELCKVVAVWLHESLLKSPFALGYVQQRGFKATTFNQFHLGFFPGGITSVKNLISYVSKYNFLAQDLLEANILSEGKTVLYSPFEDRLIFPIKDHLGRFCGFGGRVIKAGDDRPKYYNSKENEYFQKGSLIFGLDLAKKSIQEKESAFLVEGYTDCMAMVQHGMPNTIATLGTACTSEHLKLLSRYANQLYLVYDGDKAGQQAMLRLTELCWQVNMELKVVPLPAQTDPASFLHKGNSIQPLVAKSQDIFSYFIESLGKEFSSKSLQEKLTVTRKLIVVIQDIQDPLKRDILLQKASKTLDIPLASLQNELDSNLPPEVPENSFEAQALEKIALERTDTQKLEKKIFCAIMNNMQLFSGVHEKCLLDYLPNPLHDILEKLKLIKDEAYNIDFIGFFEKLNDKEKKYVSSLLLEFDEVVEVQAFEMLILQLHKKNWKVIVHSIKSKLAQAKSAGDTQAMQKIMQDFQELKQNIQKNFV